MYSRQVPERGLHFQARPQLCAVVALLLLSAIAVGRVVATYRVFNQTSDEGAHLAAGMEWLDAGVYMFETLHPPLARVAVALGPYLSGLRLTGEADVWAEGNNLLHARNRYLYNLALARLGVLPFFLLAIALVWLWSRRMVGDAAAIMATALFTTLPPVLAHAGLATTDMSLAACLAAWLLAFQAWLEKPSDGLGPALVSGHAGPSFIPGRASTWRPKSSAALGLWTGLALLSKFSALIFLPCCAVALLAWRWVVSDRATEPGDRTSKRVTGQAAVIALVAFLVIWGGYRFSFRLLANEPGVHPEIGRFIGKTGRLHDTAYFIAEKIPIPAGQFLLGIKDVVVKNRQGHVSYLLGEVRVTGWWYYFPVAIAVKTPLPFLVLAAAGLVLLLRRSVREKEWRLLAPGVASAAIVLACLPSSITIGLRHVLPIYPLLAIPAGFAAVTLWKSSRPRLLGRVTVMALLLWQAGASVAAHPDYLAYFNELAGRQPDRILVGSDLDWGQDLLRLSADLRSRGIQKVNLAYYGTADLTRHGLPAFQVLPPYRRATGWIAISEISLKTGNGRAPYDGYAWLRAYKPVALVGRSIRLYYLPQSGDKDTTATE